MFEFDITEDAVLKTAAPFRDALLPYNGYCRIRFSTDSNSFLYHQITDPSSGASVYPDMMLKHPFGEASVSDSALYRIALDKINQYGSGCCFFLSVSESDLTVLLPEFFKHLTEYLSAAESLSRHTEPFTEAESAVIERMSRSLLLTETLSHAFYQLMLYYHECGGDIFDLLTPFEEEYALPVPNKAAGKELYERIRNYILG